MRKRRRKKRRNRRRRRRGKNREVREPSRVHIFQAYTFTQTNHKSHNNII